jgi:hypothetical protein
VGRPTRIEGYAIVSEDGMLAGTDGVMPDSLKFEADQKFFRDGLDGVDAVIHGRHSHEQQPHSPRRHRIWVTARVKRFELEKGEPRVLLWNPEGASFEQAWDALGVDGSLGVVGGTIVFGMFLDRYDLFYLTRAPGVTLPGGRPVFPDVPKLTPEAVLKSHGMKAEPPRVLDAARNLSVIEWKRATK